MFEYTIEPITAEDIAEFCAAVDQVSRERKYLSFLVGPSLEMAQQFVTANIQDNWPHFVAKCDGKIIGWCDITSLHREIHAHCGTLGIGILDEHRGKGIGDKLIRMALEKARARGLTRISLTVMESNKRAIALYEKFGFQHEGVQRNASRIDGKYENHFCMALLFE